MDLMSCNVPKRDVSSAFLQAVAFANFRITDLVSHFSPEAKFLMKLQRKGS